ncbi:MAG: DUF481 domain-containing protein [Phycisphaerae bacterium]|nr:DUF481 domain-containing protein [Phycisphaerae bacterium]
MRIALIRRALALLAGVGGLLIGQARVATAADGALDLADTSAAAAACAAMAHTDAAVGSLVSLGTPTLDLSDPPAAEAPPADAPKKDGRLQPGESFFKGWKSQVEGGLTGSAGNSETLNLRFGLTSKRVATDMETTFGIGYLYATDSGDKTKSRGQTDIRNDWLLGDTPWSIFAIGKAEYDEFQDWDWRVSAYGGVGYKVIRTERVTWNLRAGAGIAREFGGQRNDIVPEGLLGWDFNWKINDRASFFNTFDFYPSLKDLSEYRFNTKAGIEVVIDPDMGLSLKAGVEDKYQSSPGPGKKRNDIEYFLTLAFSF